VKVQRLRTRSIARQELSLPSWQGWSARDPLDERALERLRIREGEQGNGDSVRVRVVEELGEIRGLLAAAFPNVVPEGLTAQQG
jgi:hypothetical protein